MISRVHARATPSSGSACPPTTCTPSSSGSTTSASALARSRARAVSALPGASWPHKNHARLFEAFARSAASRPGASRSCSPAGHDGPRCPAGVAIGSGRGARRARRALPHAPPASSSRACTRASAFPPLEAMACGCPVAAARLRARSPRCVATPPALRRRSAGGDRRGRRGRRSREPDELASRGLARARPSRGRRRRSPTTGLRRAFVLTRASARARRPRAARRARRSRRSAASRAARVPASRRRRGRGARPRPAGGRSCATCSRHSSPTWANAHLDELLTEWLPRSRRRSRPARPAAASATSRGRSRLRIPSRGGRSRSPRTSSTARARRDRRRAVRDLAREEVERPPRRLVVVEDPASRRRSRSGGGSCAR